MIAVSSAKWFLVCYVWDVYRLIDLLKASAMTVFSTVRKIDSIKKRMRKLTGMEKGWAKWMTNVRNERGKILVTFLTDSESTRSLQPMANGLVKSFERRQRENSLLLHLDRACIKGCHFWFTTFLVLFVLEPLVQVWVRFSFIDYVSLFFALGVIWHIVYWPFLPCVCKLKRYKHTQQGTQVHAEDAYDCISSVWIKSRILVLISLFIPFVHANHKEFIS